MNQNLILNSNVPEGIILIDTVKHEDHRGYFSETFNQKKIINLKI